MHSKCINSTSGRKYLTENGFDIDVLCDVKILAVRRCFRLFWEFFSAHEQLRPYYYFRFKIWRHIWIHRSRFPTKTRSFRARDTTFGDFRDHNVCACVLSTLILLPVASQICHWKWIQRPRFPIRHEHFTRKPTFKAILSKLAKKLEVKLSVRTCL